MYNGIGLTTARGSGTNGYVQRNLSHVPTKQKRIEYKTEEDIKRLDAELNRGPNPEILQHARKRQIELKCLEMRELMEEQNYAEEEIETKVAKFRKMLYDKEAALDSHKVTLEKDEFGRPIARDSHEIAQAQAEKNRRFKEALGISADYVDGSSLEKLSKQDEVKQELVKSFDDSLPTKPSSRPESSVNSSGSETQLKESKKGRKEKKEKSKKKSHKKHRTHSPVSESSDSRSSSPIDRKHSSSRRHEKNRSRSRSPKNKNDGRIKHSGHRH